jgi:ribosomal protein S27AE
MSKLSPEQIGKIVKKIEEKGATLPCPRCGNGTFAIAEGYFNQTIQPDSSGLVIGGGLAIPSAVLVCTKCGFISQHALVILGLLPQQAQQEKAEPEKAKQ